jgi:hypothetical protein
MMRLLNRYGAADMDLAVKEALVAGVQHPNAVRLEARRSLSGLSKQNGRLF